MASHSKQWNRVEIPDRVKERAHTRWELELDCWVSTYSTGSHGYAQIGWNNGIDRHVVLAHKASWEYSMGPVPLGHTIDHLCKTKKCVNPAHLRVLSNFENARRTFGRDWEIGECVNGHSNEFLRKDGQGKRFCVVCETTIWPSTRRLHGPKRRPEVRRSGPQVPKTHCKRGHLLSDDNLYVRPRGTKECLTCKKLLVKKWAKAKRASKMVVASEPNPQALTRIG